MKRTSLFTYRNLFVIAFLLIAGIATGQEVEKKDTLKKEKLIQRIPPDSTQQMNMNAVYNRPFLTMKKVPIAVGGYMEVNTNYSGTDGVSDGFTFEMRRLSLFLSGTITKKIKFLTELEFENGTEEINVEYCAVDFQFHPLLTLRGGVMMNPIGAYNQNHDGPKWDFINRPISAEMIIPTTLSNTGMGINGQYYMHKWSFGYEFYLTNGFNGSIIDNEEGRTSLHAAKENPFRFSENTSGLPMYSGKAAIRHRNIGELGLSYMTGVYNQWQADGMIIDDKRSVSVFGIDFNTSLFKNRLSIMGEYLHLMVERPENYIEMYGSRQWGGYVDVIGTVLKRKMFGWEKAKLNVGIRCEYDDFNVGKFSSTLTNIGDDVWAFTPTIAFRPVPATVIRFNYRFEGRHDLLNNPVSRTNVIQLGFSTYF